MFDAKQPRDLLRRPPQAQQHLDLVPQLWSGFPPHRPTPPSPSSGVVVSPKRPISLPATIVTNLSPHRRAVPPQPRSDLGIGLATVDTDSDLLPLSPTQHTKPRLVLNNMTHPAMLVDQPIHRAHRQARTLSSLTNCRTPSQSQQRLPRHQPRSLTRMRHNPPPGSPRRAHHLKPPLYTALTDARRIGERLGRSLLDDFRDADPSDRTQPWHLGDQGDHNYRKRCPYERRRAYVQVHREQVA